MGIKLSIMLTLLCSSLYAHKIEGIDLSLSRIGSEELLIQGEMKKGKKALTNNKIALISMIDNRILSTHFMTDSKGVKVKIPNESYWVYLYIGDQDVVKEGPPPVQGFQKIAASQEGRAFRYTFGISIFLLIMSVLLGAYKSVQIKRRKIQIL